MTKKRRPLEWVALEEAHRPFRVDEDGGGKNLDLVRRYVACRLVVEGGFHPDLITPRPPSVVKTHTGRRLLHDDASATRTGKAPVPGGLKTQYIDVRRVDP